MKKIIHFVIIFSLFLVLVLPTLLYTVKNENKEKNITTSIKINDETDINYLLDNDKILSNTQLLIFEDNFYLNKANEDIIENLVSKGYKLGLSLDLSSKSFIYTEEIKKHLLSFNIKVIFLLDKNAIYDSSIAYEIITFTGENGISIGLVENKQQNGLHNSELMQYNLLLNGISNRTLFVNKTDISTLSEKEFSFRLLRSVVDRGIRFLVIEAEDINDIYYFDQVYGNLSTQLINKGYSILNNEISTVSVHNSNFKTVLIVILFVILITYEFFKLVIVKCKKISVYMVLGSILLISLIVYIINFYALIICLTLLITVLVPVNVTIRLYNSRKFITENNVYFSIIKDLTISFLYYLVYGLIIWLAISSFAFRIGFITYKFAILSYILPIILILLYVYKDEKINLGYMKPNPRTTGIFLFILFIMYIYLSRSGNYSLFPASKSELWFRMFLEEKLYVRPRIKEIFIGYPIFFLLHSKNIKNNTNIYVYLLLGTTIIGVSILNTFCHGFTSIDISILRVFYGYLFGILVGTVVYFACKSLSFFGNFNLNRN